MQTVLICHAGARFDQEGLARWLASFSHLAGVMVLRESTGRGWKRIRTELKRSGLLGFLDVVAFRLQYKLRRAASDRQWETHELARLAQRYAAPSPLPEVLETSSPNSPEALAFLQRLAPDVVLARCKTLLKPQTFQIARHGTFVLHPGMCPEYRNAHGAFWALANGEPEKVAVTLLKIDAGVDTGPVYGYYSYGFDPVQESHLVIQQRCITENLDTIRDKFLHIVAGTATPLDTRGRPSATWGQPWWSRSWNIKPLVHSNTTGPS